MLCVQPIDVTSPASVRGLLLLGALVVFAMGCAAFAIVIYYVWGRKAPPLFADVGEDKKCIVDAESASTGEHSEDRQQQRSTKAELAHTKVITTDPGHYSPMRI